MKRKYKLTFLHKLLCMGLLIGALLSLGHSEAYQKELEGAQGTGFVFLQKGDYVLDIYYNTAPKNNEIIIYSEELINEENQPGVELFRVDVGKNGGKERVALALEQDTYNVRLKTALDNETTHYITKVALQSVQLQNHDNYLLGLLCILGAVVILVLGWYVPVEKYAEPAVLVVMGLAAGMPLFSDFLINGDDLGFHVARLEAVYQGLRAGEFPVYLGSTQMGGFGTLSATMYPQLFLYPFAWLRFFGVSLMLCYKLLLVCMHIGSAFTSYFGAKHMCKSSQIGFWASLLYTFSIYRLTNTYFRAALGETLAMVFLPLIIWGIYEVFWGNHKKWYLLVLGVSGVLHSHVSSVAMCMFFMIIELVVWLISTRKKAWGRRILAGAKAVGMTMLLNAFFLIPFLFYSGEELQCFDMPNQLSETVVYFSQMFSLFAPAQGADLEKGSTVGEMPHTIGLVLLLGAVCLCVAAMREREKQEDMQVGKCCLVYGAVALLLTSWLFPWDKVQKVEMLHDIITSLQFSWRFMGPASALLSIAGAVGIVRFCEGNIAQCAVMDGVLGSKGKWMYGVVAVLLICSTSHFFGMKGSLPVQFHDKMEFNGYGYTDAMYMYSDGESFQPLHLNYNRTDAYIVTQYGADVKYSDYKRQGMKLQVMIDAPDAEDYLLFPFYYYPGYEVLIDGEAAEVLSLDSRVACKMPKGIAEIEVAYRGMPEFVVANWVSLLTMVGILIYNIALYVRTKRQSQALTRGNNTRK